MDSELRVEKTEIRFSDWLGSETVQLKTPVLQAQTSRVLTDMKPTIGAMKITPTKSRIKVVDHWPFGTLQ